MASFNKIVLIGELQTPVDIKATTAGDAIATFDLVVPRPLREGVTVVQKDILRVVAWRQVADQARHLQINDQVLVEGAIRTKTVEDPQKGKQYLTEIDAREVRSIGGVPSGAPLVQPVKEAPVSHFAIQESPSDAGQAFDFGSQPLKSPQGWQVDAAYNEEEIPF